MAVGGLARLQPQRRAVPEHSQRDGGDHGAADAALLSAEQVYRCPSTAPSSADGGVQRRARWRRGRRWSLEAWNHNRACSGQRGLNRSVSDHGRLPGAVQKPGFVMNKVPDPAIRIISCSWSVYNLACNSPVAAGKGHASRIGDHLSWTSWPC